MLGVVSFFTDFSSEMIYPLLPVFLSQVLGAGAMTLGVIEGVAETTAALFKMFSGARTDRVQRRKPLVIAGYGIASFARPLIGIASSWTMVLGFRFLDRIGKGIRSSPRDALIADVTASGERGAAYGFHRSMDHAGAVVGPLVAGTLLSLGAMQLRSIFFLAAIPGLIALLVLLIGVREPASHEAHRGDREFHPLRAWRCLGKDFRFLHIALLVFTLGNSTDAFLLMRLSKAGIPAGQIAVLWSIHHVVKMVANYYGGRSSDHFGTKTMILTGWIFYAAIYACFALVESPTLLILVFIAYGIYFGLVEPAERSLVADFAPSTLRGTAFGFYHLTVGLGALPASILFGFIWQTFSASAAFIVGAALALVAAVLLTFVRHER